MIRCLLICLIFYGLVSDVLSRILWLGVLCFISYLIAWCLMFCLVFYGLVSDILSHILRFGV